MSSAFCSLEEAFTGPVVQPGKKKKEKGRSKDGGVPSSLAGFPGSSIGSEVEPMSAPPADSTSRPEAAVALNEFFPLPGESAEPEEWAKAFTLEGSNMPGAYAVPRQDGAVSVAGKSTLWRNVPVPSSSSPVSPIMSEGNSDIHRRLDALARQLEALSSSPPVQGTAELFLFIALGLLFLLAIDTLLRCATAVAVSMRGGARRLHGVRRLIR